MIKVDGTMVVVEFGDGVLRFEAGALDERCREAAIANAIASRFASVLTAAKGKSEEEVKRRLERMVADWGEGRWTRQTESAEEKLAKKLGMTVEELMERLGK